MKNRTRKTITALLGGAVTFGSSGAFAEVKEHPYQLIVARNPFALRPVLPPPVVEPPPAPPTPPTEIKITGLSTLLERALVFLEFTDPQTRKTDRPAPMRVGDTYHGTIAIVSIDAENSRVLIRNNGVERTLDFEKDGLKPTPPTATSPAAQPPRVANFSPPVPPKSSGRVLVGGPEIGQPNSPPVVPTPPPMTRAEAEERLAQLRELYQQQNHPAANILPPGRSGIPNLPPSPSGIR